MSTSDRWLGRLWASGVAAAAALVLAACGPGVGGTGTGETQAALSHFGATPASACGGDLAPWLGCTAGSASAAPAAAVLHLADTIDGRRVVVRVQGNLIDVSAPCARLQFNGEWGVIAGQAGRFYGNAELGSGAVPATLEVVASGGGVQITVRDAGGAVLLGPVLLVQVTAPAAPGACG